MLTETQYTDLVAKLGKDAAEAVQKEMKRAEEAINGKIDDVNKGAMKLADFEIFKKEHLDKVNDVLEKLGPLDEAQKQQGIKINEILTNQEKENLKGKGVEDFIDAIVPKLVEFKKNGMGVVEFTGSELRKLYGMTTVYGAATVKAPAITSVTNAIPTASPYAPGIQSGPLQIFDLVYSPNFIISRVNMGSTDSARLAWINEIPMEGSVGTAVAESGEKPLIQHRFEVVVTTPDKVAAYMQFTEEFQDDLPQLYSLMRNLLNDDVMRAFDNALQAKVVAAARPYNITGLNSNVQDANYWDALLALITQVGHYEFYPNTLAISWITDARVRTTKNLENDYLVPPFVDEINALRVRANKIALGFALVGDLNQYQVRIYKDFTIRLGWINDDFRKNQFGMVGELRYHSFISENRKNAIVYSNLDTVATQIDGLPGS